MFSLVVTDTCSPQAAKPAHRNLMIHVLHLTDWLIQCRHYECRNARGPGPQLAAAHPPAPSEARISPRQDLAPPAGDRCDRSEECRACAADERGEPGGL